MGDGELWFMTVLSEMMGDCSRREGECFLLTSMDSMTLMFFISLGIFVLSGGVCPCPPFPDIF